MRHLAPPIGVAAVARGILVTLPPRLWLLVSLRAQFRRLEAAPAAWTYLIPDAGAGARLERWIAAVEQQLAAERRRRAWSASDAEWDGAARPPAPTASTAPAYDGEALAIAVATALRSDPNGALARLLARMGEGQTLTAEIAGGARTFRLLPSGRAVRASVALRAIAGGLVAPGRDGLFGPDDSQTWHSPSAQEVTDAGKDRCEADRAPADPGRQARRTRPVLRLQAVRPGRRSGQRQEGQGVPQRSRPAAARRAGGVA